MLDKVIEPDEFLSDAQMCELLGITLRTSGRWRAEGRGPRFIRIGGSRVRYRRADLDAWISERTFTHRTAELAALHPQLE